MPMKSSARKPWSRLLSRVGIFLIIALAANTISRAQVKLPKTWVAGDTLTAADINGDLAALNDAMVDLSSDQVITGLKAFSNASFQERVGIGTDAPQGSVEIHGHGGWSSWNFGKQLIISTVPNNSHPSIAILDRYNSSPWAITNGAGDLEFSQMPSLDNNTTAPTVRVMFQADGTTLNSTGMWATLSDERLKRDIHPITGALDTVSRLEGVSFRWKDAKKDRELGRVEGFIAQDVERVKPAWVRVNSDGYRTLQTVGIDAILVEAIKEQQKQIHGLERENRRQQERLEHIEAVLQASMNKGRIAAR